MASDRGHPKPRRVSDPDYLRWLRSQPCCVCQHLGEPQRTRTEAHHVTKTRGAGGGDDGAAPFCVRHHKLWHLLGRKSFAARVGFDPTTVAARLWREWKTCGWSTNA